MVLLAEKTARARSRRLVLAVGVGGSVATRTVWSHASDG